MDFTGQKAKSENLARKNKKKTAIGKRKKKANETMDTSNQFYFMGRWYKDKDKWEAAYQKHNAAVEADHKKA